MREIATVRLGLAKNVFQVHAFDAAGGGVIRRQVRQARMPLDLRVGQFGDTKARIDAITTDLRRAAEADETARRLQAMPGIGPITASVRVATLPDVSAFRSARDLSAWLGLARPGSA